MKKYKEIYKLKEMLDEAHIPYEFQVGWGYNEEAMEELRAKCPDLMEHYHIGYPSLNENTRWISVIERFGTYGAEDDKLEIMGGLTPLEQLSGDGVVMGWLTAEDVFNRIKKNWEEKLNEEKDNEDRRRHPRIDRS